MSANLVSSIGMSVTGTFLASAVSASERQCDPIIVDWAKSVAPLLAGQPGYYVDPQTILESDYIDAADLAGALLATFVLGERPVTSQDADAILKSEKMLHCFAEDLGGSNDPSELRALLSNQDSLLPNARRVAVNAEAKRIAGD